MASPVQHFSKTRIAPTPSGYLHLGNVLSFAITAAMAQQTGAKILLRIDDLDQARVNEPYIQDIFDTLDFLEIPWDEGPRTVKEFTESYSQLHRIPLYRDALHQLHQNGLVYACTCSRKQLQSDLSCSCFEKHIPLNTENASWRLITDKDSVLNIKLPGGEIKQAALPTAMQNFIVKKRDGYPAYQLTSVIDDIFYCIDLVVRGHDLWPSTLAQQQLAVALNEPAFKEIAFYHHPLLLETSGQKLSKSAGATSIKYLRESGKTPADIFTLIAGMLGINQNVTNWQQLAVLINAPV